jgi:parallel beta-helix repeat protein
MPASAAHPDRRSRSCVRVLLITTFAVSATVGLLLLSPASSSAAVPTGWTEVGSDSFSRTVSGQWGSADRGGAFSVSGGGSSVASTGGVGVVTLAPGHRFGARLSTVSARDVDVSDTAKVTGGSAYDVLHGWSVRRQADGSRYEVRLRFSNATGSTLGVARVNGSTSKWLGAVTVPQAFRAGQLISSEFQATGTSPVVLRARAWVTGSTKPNWQVVYSDANSLRIQAAGSVELLDYLQTGDAAVTVGRDNLTVGALTASAPSPTPDPLPPSVPSAAGRGSAPIGSASYPVPSGAIFVSPAGSDGGTGTQASPYHTVAHALASAPVGRTVVLRGGTYHESVTSSKTVTLQNFPGEAVWFDGSVPITNWTHSGSVWVSSGWNASFSNTMGGDAAFKQRFIGANPMAADPDQAFVNGTQLKQVASASSVVAGTFMVDDDAHTLTIGTDPSGKEVRGANLARAVYLSGKNSVIRGIGFRRYANGYEVTGAVKLSNTGGTIRNVVVQDMATTGISISNNDKTVDHVTVQRAGQLGIGGTQNDNSVVSNSIVTDNNTENFKDAPVSGGLKFTSARTMTVRNVDASHNIGSGIWFDVSCYDLTVVNNVANYTTKHGIEMEVSAKAIIANNQAINGGDSGIIVYDSSDVKVFNNEVGGNQLFGIWLSQDQRRQALIGRFYEARDPRFRTTVDPTMTWVTKNIQVSNNVFGNKGLYQVFAMDGATNRAVDTWNLTVDGNLFNKRVASSDPTLFAWGRDDNKTRVYYQTPAELAAAKNSRWKNVETDSSKSIGSMNGDKTTFAWTAVPIPSDIAAVTGLNSGARLLGVH